MSTGYDPTDDRLFVMIPYPAYIPRARGIHAKGKFGTMFKAKCSIEEKDLVDRAADHTGLSIAEYIRWVVVQASKEVLKHAEPSEDHSSG